MSASKNEIVVNDWHDYEDIIGPDGMPDTNFLYRVVSCDVAPESAILQYDRVNFPAVCGGAPTSVAAPDPLRSLPPENVNNRSVVGLDVLELLRERGVQVTILPRS